MGSSYAPLSAPEESANVGTPRYRTYLWVRLTGVPAPGAAGRGMAQIAAINIARVAFPNCFTDPTFFSATSNQSLCPDTTQPPPQNTSGVRSFTSRYPYGQQPFTQTVRCRYWPPATSGRAAEGLCIPPANRTHRSFVGTTAHRGESSLPLSATF